MREGRTSVIPELECGQCGTSLDTLTKVYIFPDTAKNITLIHRVASNWPDPKRLEIK